MKKIHRKYCIALALLNIFALLKVTLVPNLQHTALYYAGERGFNEIVEKLLENGAE